MTNTEKLAAIVALLGADAPSDTSGLTALLSLAEKEILNWRYSYSPNGVPSEFPPGYDVIEIYAVVAGFTQIGAEGEIRHDENGVERTFKHDSMVSYIRSHVIPIAGVM